MNTAATNATNATVSVTQQYIQTALSKLEISSIWQTQIIMTILATAIVYFASISTLEKPKTAQDPDKKSKYFHPLDFEKSMVEERMSKNEAYLMPVMGGIALLSLYFAFRYFDADAIQKLMKYYFIFAICLSLASSSSLIIKGGLRLFFNTSVPSTLITMSSFSNTEPIPSPDDIQEVVVPKDELITIMTADYTDIFCIPFAVFMTYAHATFWSNNWIIGNIIGASLAITGIRTMRLGSFTVGLIVFIGMFLYDIYFVFGTDVMMTVATKVEAPVKLLVPRPPRSDTEHKPMSLLGLGDIVLPAMVVSLCLRFDSWRYYQGHKTSFHLKRPFPKTYFHATMFAYAAGLVFTILVMSYFQAGQPALLYLCPAIGFTVFAVGVKRNELKLLKSYDESPEKKEGEEEGEGKDDDKEELSFWQKLTGGKSTAVDKDQPEDEDENKVKQRTIIRTIEKSDSDKKNE